MIGSAELLGGFYGYHIPDGFNDTDHILSAHGIGTYRAYVRVSHIMTTVTKPDVLPHFENGFPESPCSGRILFQKMKNQP
jgi:hypothetical protein